MVYIEKVSLRGFKSFGNQRVGIPLSKGFTAIVGPNGSGKSNVVDGICFVLGRMSTKSMRAEKFSDLIWAGSQHFPAGSYAEVSLHLNNSDRKLPLDESKVVISRRVDRSGRSVYRTNKSRVNRNDVVDLLAMAGIFPEGYNIVLQGDITRLVKMSPLERRMLIDELSGIAEYDLKKERSIRELSKAEENIRATNLVIDEVLSQLRRLERERDEAVRYQDIISQVRELRWQLQHNQLRKSRERYDAILERTKKGSERIADIEKSLNEINSMVQKEQERQEELQRTIEKRQEIDLERAGKQNEEIRAQIVRAQENLKNAKENLERQRLMVARLEEEIRGMEDRIKGNENRIRVLQGQSTAILAATEGYRARQSELQAQMAKLEESNSEMRQQLSKLEASLKQARSSETVARQRSSQATVLLGEARQRLAYLQRSVQDESSRLSALLERKKRQEGEVSDLTGQLAVLGKEITSLVGELDRTNRSLSETARDLQEKSNQEARMEALLRAAKESENPMKRAVAFLLAKRDDGSLPGIIGTVSEMAKVPEEYRVPISAATGHLSDFIIVENREIASSCMRLLRENRAGWATFIPLRDIERVGLNQAFLGAKGVVDLALNMVEFDDALQPAYEFVLGSTVVTEDLDSSSKLPRKLRTVTLNGEILDPSGAVSGGHYDPLASGFGPMLSFSEKDLASLRDEIGGLTQERNALSASLDNLRSTLVSRESKRAEHQARIDGARNEILLLEQEISRAERRLAEASSAIGEAEEALKQLSVRSEEADGQAKKASEDLDELEKQRDEILKRIEGSELREREKEYRALSSAVSQRVESHSGVGSEIAALEREVELLREASTRSQEELRAARQSMTGLQIIKDKIERDVPSLEKELSQISTSQDEIREQIKELKMNIYEKKQRHSELVQKRDSLVEDKNRLSVDVNSLVYERSQLDVEIHQLEHQLSLVDYEYEPIEIDNLEELSRRMMALEAERAKLEPVNMRAIEAYEETEAKFNEYKERRDKVMEEREAILQFMNEIEAKKRQVFMEAFDNIAANFSRIFAKLSPGGLGKLILENHDDPFQGGLEIEAKPAGKEVNVIDSMSGGEKALTALAFIFAVQLYKPSPFYVLDEIDAHLDDDNVKRVAELIAETSKNSQFIVVTLRDSMMAQADELIGVSMEENGVSKVVGVRMEAGKIVEGGTVAEPGGAEA